MTILGWRGKVTNVLMTIIIAGCLTLSACPAPLDVPMTNPDDPQVQFAKAKEAVATARQSLREAIAEQTGPFWTLRLKYGEPGPKRRLLAQSSPEERQQAIASAEKPLQREWNGEHVANDRKIAAATILGGGLAGLGAVMTARDQETVYASLDYQLLVVREEKVDLSRPECGFHYSDNGEDYRCGVTEYHRNENEALCHLVMDRTTLKEFWGQSSEGIVADINVQDELHQAYQKYIIGSSNNDRAENASRQLSEAEDDAFLACEHLYTFDECSHPEQAVQDSDEMLGPPELVKRYINDH